ncbi:MAG: cytochrome c oxidase, subunit family protein, partial [Aeromicrobium sp.]|nr:cytochrome c oxidase, subunit family protein [Aeromicrobium sp.]
YYFMMTGIHLLHVVVGCGILSIFWMKWRRHGLGEKLRGFESAAIFWHMVDLLWIFLFPLLYLVR